MSELRLGIVTIGLIAVMFVFLATERLTDLRYTEIESLERVCGVVHEGR